MMYVGSLGRVVLGEERSNSYFDKAYNSAKKSVMNIGTNGKKNVSIGGRVSNVLGDASYGVGRFIGSLIHVPHIVAGTLANLPIVGRVADGFEDQIPEYYNMGKYPIQYTKAAFKGKKFEPRDN